MEKMTVENLRTDLEKAYAGPKMDYILSVLDATTINGTCQDFISVLNDGTMSKESAMGTCFSRLSGDAEVQMWKNYSRKDIIDILTIIMSKSTFAEKVLVNGISYNAVDVVLGWNSYHPNEQFDPAILFYGM